MTDEEKLTRQIEEIAEYIHKKKLEVPAILFLETNKPLALFNGAAVTASIPFLGAVFSADKLKVLSEVLSDRRNVELLIRALEEKAGSD
ncbi:MAG: hypothetical protein IK083_01685 [Abditibacteriota bacterium]|nr:hypothetical protein [Abditibacteriota bacterium]